MNSPVAMEFFKAELVEQDQRCHHHQHPETNAPEQQSACLMSLHPGQDVDRGDIEEGASGKQQNQSDPFVGQVAQKQKSDQQSRWRGQAEKQNPRQRACNVALPEESARAKAMGRRSIRTSKFLVLLYDKYNRRLWAAQRAVRLGGRANCARCMKAPFKFAGLRQ